MDKSTISSLLLALFALPMSAQTKIDISGNNTSSSYVSYSNALTLATGRTADVYMARYCYFSSQITGGGTLNLYAGGERSYLGTAKGAAWPNWTSFKGDIHIYPNKDNAPSAGFYGVVLAHGGKTFSPENVEDAIKSGKVNPSMANNSVTLHKGATMCCEANTSGAGFRIGELNTEEGSFIQGYMKKGTRPAYFILGNLNTDATLAGQIAPPDYSNEHLVGIIKEGTGTYTISGNTNYLSGALRIMEGSVMVMNDAAKAKTSKLRGALGAKASNAEAIAYVFEHATLGGTGNIAGSVDNYGSIAPGCNGTGTLYIHNYATTANKPNLTLHPAAALNIEIQSAELFDILDIAGKVKYSTMTQDFSTSDEMPVINLTVGEDANLSVGDSFTILKAAGKTSDNGEWNFHLNTPNRYTWTLDEKQESNSYEVTLTVSSLNNEETEPGDKPGDTTEETEVMGPFYDDGIDDKKDFTALKTYAAKNNKLIGTAISTWKNDITNSSLDITKEIAKQFNLLVAENEMKFDALQPNQGEFTYWGADNLVNFAKNNGMKVRGHTLAWHSQLPQWISSDGKKNDKNWSREEALKILETHITNVVKHFKGKVSEWDVVNECLDDDQTTVRTNPEAYDLRESVWTKAIGEDFIDSAFVYAHRADPNAKLYLNDYDVEMQGKAKAVAFYNLAMRLKKSNIPIDGVGLQCHFSIGDVDSVKLDKTIRKFGEAGFDCIITELDMGIPSTSDDNLQEQARNYRVITDIMLNNDNCHSLVIWGMKDNDSWRSASSPLLYNASLNKKPAFYAVRSALRHRSIVNENVDIDTISPEGPNPFNKQDSDDNNSAENNADDSKLTNINGQAVNPSSLLPGIYIYKGKKYTLWH